MICVKAWNSHVHRDFPGKCESTNLSREKISIEIGRIVVLLVSFVFVLCLCLLALTHAPLVVCKAPGPALSSFTCSPL